MSHLKAKVYEPFYSGETNTLAILVKCEAEETLKVKNYQFQSVTSNSLTVDDTMRDKLNNLIKDAIEVTKKFDENPLNIAKTEIDRVLGNHSDMEKR